MKNETIENKKKWFKKYDKLLQVEERLRNKLELLNNKLQGASSPNYNGMPRGGRPINIDDLIIDKTDLEERIINTHNKVTQCRREILEVIDSMEDPRHASILEMHFIDGMSIDEIGEDLGYNTRTIYRLYSDAITLIEIPAIETNQ